MSVKPTTDVYAVRDQVRIEVPFIAQSQSQIEVVSIPTMLDTLNREVLMIQEVDFDILGIAYWAAVQLRTNAAIDPAVAYNDGSINLYLTEVDPNIDPSVLSLSSPHFIASARVDSVAGVYTEVDYNPDTGSYQSVAFSNHPLFTTASANLFLTIAFSYQGNDPSTMTGAAPLIAGDFRAFCQRGVADADTYAAILTGLYA
tara:strand:- start:881 stop:1483 length:603 start_codon:yes stop_codon:yes gene_type:complete